MTDELRDALNFALCDELAAALGRIVHCIMQLSEEQVWSRSRSDMNSVGNLVLHVCGNLRQLIVTGVGGAPDDRDRQAEFDARGPIASDELLGKLFDTVKQAQEVIRSAAAQTLCEPIPVERYDYTGIQAVVRAVAHFRGHAQEIIRVTREILGERYQFAGPK
jgi:hypothetical protein